MKKTSNSAQSRFTTKNCLIAAVVVVVGLAAGLAWHKYTEPQQVSLATDMDSVFEAVRKDIALLPDYKAQVQPWYGENSTGDKLPADGYTYHVLSAGLPALAVQPRFPHESEGGSTFTPSNSTQDVRDRITALMTERGFTKGQTAETLTKMSATTTLTRGDEKCTIDENRTTYELAVKCTSPKLVQNFAKQGKPFVKEYLAHHTNLREQDLTFGPLVIKSRSGTSVIGPSQTSGYDIAEAVIGEPRGQRLALYYQKQGGPWRFITDATDEYGFSCGDMRANPDARKAMYGQVCYERPDGGQRLLDSNGRATQ